MDKISNKTTYSRFYFYSKNIQYLCLLLASASALLFIYRKSFALSASKEQTTFKAHLIGWYPTKTNNLLRTIEQLDQRAENQFSSTITSDQIRAIIVPHAGYAYSGDVAAAVYRLLTPSHVSSHPKTRVIILAPSHHLAYGGIAVPTFDNYQTPLGSITIDQITIKKLLSNSLFIPHNQAYVTEHSFEIQLPFIQTYMPHAQVIPLMVGTLSKKQMQESAKTIASYIDLRDLNTLIVVSSDFTHYGKSFDYTPFSDHTQKRIMQLDSGVLQAIQDYSLNHFLAYIDQTGDTICGRNAIAILLALLENNALGPVKPHLIAYKTSAQVAGKIDESVSYVGMAFATASDNNSYQFNSQAENLTPNKFSNIHASIEDPFSTYEKNVLLSLARTTLEQSFTPPNAKIPENLLYPIATKANEAQQGVFVTLYKQKKLRGCIGETSSQNPIYKTVMAMTRAAAFNDSRFSPLTVEELPAITIAISVLTKPKPIKNYHEIKLGIDGIILTKNNKSALFLPKVATEFGWNLSTTLSELSKKAGLEPDAWQQSDTTYQIFNSIDFSEPSISK